MKFKHVVASLSLAMFAAFGAAAGLSMKKEAKAVKADGEKWMVTICFDNTIPEESGEWGYIDNQGVNFWGNNVAYEGSYESFHQSGRDHFYTVNVVFTSEQSVTGMQINFKENGVKKESQNITIALDSSCNGLVYTYAFPEEVSWVDGKWSYETVSVNQTPCGEFGELQADFVADPESKSYVLRNIEMNSEEYISLCPFTFSAHNWNDTAAVVREDATYRTEYLQTWHGDHWFEFKVSGVFDFFLTNEYVDGGILDVKKHEVVDTYIYYLSEMNFGEGATPNSIYAFGGASQFGSWPGTSIASIATEVTGRGVLRFDGAYGDFHDQSQYIYKIPVKIGYPSGDTKIIINYDGSDQGAEQELVAGAAYTWDARNVNKGAALDFLVEVEGIRNAVEASGDIKQWSVCGISQSDAAALYEEYEGIESYVVKNLINEAFAYTYCEDGSVGNEMVPYVNIMERIGMIAGVVPNPSASRFNSVDFTNSNVAIIVISIAATSALAFTLLLVFKKKRQK